MDTRGMVDLSTVRVPQGVGPHIVFGDPVPTCLIEIRDALGVQTPWDDAAEWSDPGPVSADGTTSDLWLNAWRQAWFNNELVQVATRENRPVPPIAAAEPAEWFDPSSPLPRQLPAGTGITPVALTGRSEATLSASEQAVTRGLLVLYVLPIPGVWEGHRERIMGVSETVYSSDSLLREAFDSFGSEVVAGTT